MILLCWYVGMSSMVYRTKLCHQIDSIFNGFLPSRGDLSSDTIPDVVTELTLLYTERLCSSIILDTSLNDVVVIELSKSDQEISPLM